MRQLKTLTGLIMLVAITTACAAGSRVEAGSPLPAVGPAGDPPITTALPLTQLPTAVTESAEATPLPTVEAPSSPTPLLPATATATVAGANDMDLSTATPAASPTPAPTFTPPPPPPPDPAEHFVLNRPVPADSPQWTDKAYPYGSTRGGTLQTHHGVEFNVPTGTPVLAAGEGVVRFAGPDDMISVGPLLNFYGKAVIIEQTAPQDSGTPLYTLYGHLSDVLVEVGQRVNAGEVVGVSGDSGVAYGPHLHFEVRQGENAYSATRNPLLWLKPFSGLGVVAAQIAWPDGSPVVEAPVVLRRVDGQAPYTAGTTYAAGGINSDDQRMENLVLDDVVPGYYELEITSGSETLRQTLWVFPDRTTFLGLTLP